MEPTRKHSSVAPSTIDVDGNGNVTITMKELFTGWFEINNLKAPSHSTLRFYVSTTTGIASEFAMVDGNCYKITDASVIALSKGCTHLTNLILEGCDQITDASVIALSNGCPQLTFLSVTKTA